MAYNPREDDRVYLGTQMLDNIENGVIGTMEWLQNQAQDDPDRYTDDMLRLLGGGVKNIGWAISKIPFLDKIAQGEDWLAGKAREMSAELTPWLDPRFAGWGTRIGTGILADKGIRKATLLGKAKWGKYQMGKAFQKGSQFIPEEAILPTLDSDLGLQMMAQIDGFKKVPKTDLPSNWMELTTPEKRYIQIQRGYKAFPTIEDLNLATTGPGYEVGLKAKSIKPGHWKGYTRPSPTSRKKWAEIMKPLQKKHNATDAQVQDFINIQRKAYSTIEDEIKQVNQRFKFDYLEFASTALDSIDDMVPEGVAMITDEDLYMLYLEMASNPKKYPVFAKGHINSAKNIAREGRVGVPMTADYASNLRIEINRSIRDFKIWNPKSKEYKLVEPGNLKRGARMDAPKIINLIMGTSPNVEVEFLRYLGDFGRALDNIIPFERHDHFMQYLRRNIRRWQGRGKNALIGQQQLDQFPAQVKRLIDNYLNALDEGKFIGEGTEIGVKAGRAKSQFIDDALLDRRLGREELAAREAEGRAAIRGIRGTVFNKKGSLDR